VLCEFDPYVDNSGTVIGLAGKDFVMLGADTRLSDSYFIRSRQVSRLHELGGGDGGGGGGGKDEQPLVFCGAGCWSDNIGLVKVLTSDVRRYAWENKMPLSVNGLAHLLSTTLFARRTFPYYSHSIVSGLDEQGRGALFRFDAVGSFERVRAACIGKGEQLIQPMLDEVSNMEEDGALWIMNAEGDAFLDSQTAAAAAQGGRQESAIDTLTEQQAFELVVKAFRAAAEREISIGDGVDIWLISKDSKDIKRTFVALPRH